MSYTIAICAIIGFVVISWKIARFLFNLTVFVGLMFATAALALIPLESLKELHAKVNGREVSI